jgi:hypothetical protein
MEAGVARSLVSEDAPSEASAVRTKGVRERTRAQVGGARGASFTSRDALARAAREAGRLSEQERAELVIAWGGHGAALGPRSSQGAIEDQLLRAPPREGAHVERAMLRILRRQGRYGCERASFLDIVRLEEGVTRYEARRALRALFGRAQVEHFVAEKERRAPERRRLEDPYGVLTGVERRANAERPRMETVAVEMVRIAEAPAAEPGFRGTEGDEEEACVRRWARADAEVAAMWGVIACSESTRSGGGRDSPPAPRDGRSEASLRAARRLPPGERRTLERAYGTAAPLRSYLQEWVVLGEDVARIVPYTSAVEAVRIEIAREAARGKGSDGVRTAERSTFAVDAVRHVLDGVPEEGPARERWQAERTAFIARAGREAAAMLRSAVEAYREQRG